jgi:Bacteriophage minor capsid protein
MTIDTYLGDLAAYLQTNNIGTVGSDIFFMGLDESATNCISLTPHGGNEPRSIVSGETADLCSPSVQILIRNISASAGLLKASTIYKLLRVVSNKHLGTTQFLAIKPVSSPQFVAKTDGGYYLFTVNFDLLIQ